MQKDVDIRRAFSRIFIVQASDWCLDRRVTEIHLRTSNMKRTFLKAMAAGAGIILAGSVGVRADLLYQNTTTQTGPVLTLPNNGDQVGEQIWLGTGVTPEYLTNFSFEYYSPDATWSGTVTADVRFYENDGTPFNTYATPGTLFYDSGPITFLSPLSYSESSAATAIYDLSDLQYPPGGMTLDPNFALPANFTFTVTFSGLTGSESVGLPIFEPPTWGTNYGDYWYDLSGNWELLTNALGPVGFGAEFNGSPTPTPEPTVLCLGALGAAALTVLARRRQRRG
jgi:hypothetical protein